MCSVTHCNQIIWIQYQIGPFQNVFFSDWCDVVDHYDDFLLVREDLMVGMSQIAGVIAYDHLSSDFSPLRKLVEHLV